MGAIEKKTASNLPHQLSATRKAGAQLQVVGSHSRRVVPDDCSSAAVLCTSVSGFPPAERLEEKKEGVCHSHCHTATIVCLFHWKLPLIRFVIRKEFLKISPKFCTWMWHSFSAYVNDELSTKLSTNTQLISNIQKLLNRDGALTEYPHSLESLLLMDSRVEAPNLPGSFLEGKQMNSLICLFLFTRHWLLWASTYLVILCLYQAWVTGTLIAGSWCIRLFPMLKKQ